MMLIIRELDILQVIAYCMSRFLTAHQRSAVGDWSYADGSPGTLK